MTALSPTTSSTTAFVTQSIFSLRPRAVEHDLGRAEVLAAVNDCHLVGELRQERRLLHRRVAAADDHDLLLPEERRVADGAVRDAAALQPPLGVELELPGVRAGGHDDRLGAVLLVADVDAERTLGEVDAGDVVGDELGAEALGLAPEVLHHLGPEDAFHVAGVVLDVARDHQLTAPLEAFDHERLEICAGSVERGRVPGRTASDDDQFANVLAHVSLRKD